MMRPLNSSFACIGWSYRECCGRLCSKAQTHIVRHERVDAMPWIIGLANKLPVAAVCDFNQISSLSMSSTKATSSSMDVSSLCVI